jgi:CMP-N,N'-diacetyllegionaminic acid synthase
MKILAIIPARGGSKGIPRKNIAPLGGRPLIGWTIRAALDSKLLQRVIVSTDDEEIASAARAGGAEAPFLRPAAIANDSAPALDVIRHALAALPDGADFDAVAYLQPTSPFRTAVHIDEAVALFAREQPDTLVSMMQVPHNMVPGSTMRMLPGQPGLLELSAAQPLRRQDKEVLYARNGPAILIVSARLVLEQNKLYGERVMGYLMDRLSSLDIDEPADLAMAECLLPLVRPIQGAG